MASDDGKRIRLRYAGTCRVCEASVAAGEQALHFRETRQIICLRCAEPGSDPAPPIAAAAPDSGTAGASARREHQRRVEQRDKRIRAAHPRLGGLILALTDEPQSTTAWSRGARGEELLGRRLDGLAERGVLLLHDRRIPRTRANIDHIAVGPAGVFVIDAKRYRGRPELRIDGGILRPRTEKLVVGGRDCTALVQGAIKQADVVRAALASDADLAGTPVRGMLCFIEADWPLFGGTFRIAGIEVLYPAKAADLITAEGPLTPQMRARVHTHLATALPAA